MPVIPELAVPDPEAARALLARVFGFAADGALMRLGSQAVALTGGTAGHGVIDHLALAVPDLDRAMADALARGASADPAVTPDGPLEIAEFGAAGVRYLFLLGPGEARIELIQDLAAPHGAGHDHIGIPCADIAATAAFFHGLGARLHRAVTLRRQTGDIEVRFLRWHGSVLELYRPPAAAAVAGQGKWRRLLAPVAAPATGPEGLTVAPLEGFS